MKKLFLTLAGTTALLSAGAATAADVVIPDRPLIVAEEAPTGYVSTCDAVGEGYFYIPGSETCMRISGSVAVTFGHDGRADETFAGTTARINVDTSADTEVGEVTTKFSYLTDTNYDDYYLDGTPARTTDIDLAYLTVGPMFAGYKETLFNTNLGYSDFNLETNNVTSFGNSTSLGFMAHNVYGGVYFGAAVESTRRGSLTSNNGIYPDDYTPDFVVRGGIKSQPWGSFDLSGIYSEELDQWLIKATADVEATDELDLRFTAGYGENSNDEGYLLSGAAKYAFNETFSGFTGVSYFDQDAGGETTEAHLGATWTPAKNLDFTGQVTYTDLSSGDGDVNTKLTIKRSF